MEDIDLMWTAFFTMSDEDQEIVAVEINAVANKTNLSVLEGMYLLWKLGRYMNENPGVLNEHV